MTHPDIFLSYNREDAARAKQFAEAFAAQGLTVWWDVALRSGEAYDEVTEAALRSAKAVIVLWSKKSVVSRWVRAEATLADRRKTLLPAMIEACERPIMFELVQTADLTHWQGNAGDDSWQAFARQVRDFVGKEAVAAPAATTTPEPLPALDQVSVVVLPFANMSRDEEQEYFADGITEDIITDLSKVSSLRVISRNSAFTFKGRSVNVPDIARQLNVTHVLEGSVRKAGNRVRVTAQLIDGSNNDHVWAERYDRNLDDIFELQDELSRAIVSALKVNLLPQEQAAISDRGTSSPEAYDLYIRARALHLAYGFSDSEAALRLYRQALAIDPGFALAWLSLTHLLSNLRFMIPQEYGARWHEAQDAYRRGSALRPDLWETKLAAINMAVWENDWDSIAACLRGGGSEFDRGYYLATLGRVREGCDAQLEYLKQDPLSIGRSFILQLLLDAAGRVDEAEAEYLRARELIGPKTNMNWRAITRAMYHGNAERVRAIYREGELEGPEHPYRAQLLPLLEQPDRALALLREQSAEPAMQGALRQNVIANWAIHFGDMDLAFTALQRGYVESRTGIATVNFWMPHYAALRQDPRFKQILKDMGLASYWRRSGNWGDFARPLGGEDFEIIA